MPLFLMALIFTDAAVAAEGSVDEVACTKHALSSFEALDVGGDGSLSGGELTAAYSSLGGQVPASAMAQVLQDMDKNADTQIDREEYLDHMRTSARCR